MSRTTVAARALVVAVVLTAAATAIAASQHSVSAQRTHPRSKPSPVTVSSLLAGPGVVRGRRLSRGQVLIYRTASIRRSDKAGFSFSMRCPIGHDFAGLAPPVGRNTPLIGPILGTDPRIGRVQVTANPRASAIQSGTVYALCVM